jgi:hypothetical protein
MNLPQQQTTMSDQFQSYKGMDWASLQAAQKDLVNDVPDIGEDDDEDRLPDVRPRPVSFAADAAKADKLAYDAIKKRDSGSLKAALALGMQQINRINSKGNILCQITPMSVPMLTSVSYGRCFGMQTSSLDCFVQVTACSILP